MTKTAILAVENCMESSISGPMDIFTTAALESSESKKFETIVISDDGKDVRSFSGRIISPDMAKDEAKNIDILFIPVIYGDLSSLLSNINLIKWIKECHEKGVLICAVCAGTFLAAESGILYGKKATTHWSLADLFQKRYPSVNLKKEMMIVDEGDVITAGGVTAYMDLSLYIVSRFASFELSSSLSKLLLIDPSRRSQNPYRAFSFNRSHGDTEILKSQEWMEKNFHKTVSVGTLAEKSGLEMRTFARRFKKSTGDTPIEYLQHLRIGKAKSLLETTKKPIEDITYSAGYEDVSSFRRLFKRNTGMSPTAYRKRFSSFATG